MTAHSHFIRTLACAALLLPVAPAAARRILGDAECVDSTTWTAKGVDASKTCAWLSRKPEKCYRKDDSKELGYVACPKACGLCDGGEDSTSWYVKDVPSKNCEYVAKKRDERCWKKDDAKVEAWYACPQACATHTVDTCLEDFADEIGDAISGGDTACPTNDWDGGTAGVADCFSALADDLEACDSCCGKCAVTTVNNNLDYGGCVCAVLGDDDAGGLNKFQGSAYNDCIFVAGDNNAFINASIPASEAAKEHLPFPRAERGPMPPGAPKSERVRDPVS